MLKWVEKTFSNQQLRMTVQTKLLMIMEKQTWPHPNICQEYNVHTSQHS
jgi:hypothetical protein